MTEFTPITEQVRDGYACDPESEYRDPIGYPAEERRLRAAFDRWLARRDAEVAAKALEDAADRAENSDARDHPFAGLDDTVHELRVRARSLRASSLGAENPETDGGS